MMSDRPNEYPLTAEQSAAWVRAIANDEPVALTARDLDDLLSAISHGQQAFMLYMLAEMLTDPESIKRMKLSVSEAFDKANDASRRVLQRASTKALEARDGG